MALFLVAVIVLLVLSETVRWLAIGLLALAVPVIVAIFVFMIAWAVSPVIAVFGTGATIVYFLKKS